MWVWVGGCGYVCVRALAHSCVCVCMCVYVLRVKVHCRDIVFVCVSSCSALLCRSSALP